MSEILRPAQPDRMRTLAFGGGRAPGRWCAAWEDKARFIDWWTAPARQLRWASELPDLGGGETWMKDLAAALDREPATRDAPDRARRRTVTKTLPADEPRAKASPGGTFRDLARTVPTGPQPLAPDRTARPATPPESLPPCAAPADLERWAGDIVLPPPGKKRRRPATPAPRSGTRPMPPSGAHAPQTWRPRAADPMGSTPRPTINEANTAAPAGLGAWQTPVSGTECSRDQLARALHEGEAGEGGQAQADRARAAPGGRSSDAARAVSPVSSRARRPDSPGGFETDRAAGVSGPGAGATSPGDHSPTGIGAADVAAADGLLNELDPASRELDVFRGVGETPLSPHAPLGPPVLREYADARVTLPRRHGPSQAAAPGSPPSEVPLDAGERSADDRQLARRIGEILRDEARRHGIDV